MNLWIIFLTGLTTGGLTCLAMQGGLLTSVIANQKEAELEELEKSNQFDWLPVSMFLGTKFISHIMLGFLLGALGSLITLSLGMRLTFQIIAALFMFATAMNLLDVHPIFRYVVLQPPKFLHRFIRNTTKGNALFTPALLGFLTVFIPCGITQAMAVLAISTGNPVSGALIMAAFVLGTSPIFALVGVATAKLSQIWNTAFLRVAALALIVMSFYGINGVLTVLDSPFSVQRIGKTIASIGNPPEWYGATETQVQTLAPLMNGKQQIAITIASNGYSPNEFWVKKNTPVELTLQSNGAYSCATSFTFKKFNLFAQLQPNDTKTLAFTPTEGGNFSFACSMGMYQGIVHVI